MSWVFKLTAEVCKPGKSWMLRQVHRAIENGLSRLDFRPKRAHRNVRTRLRIQCGAGSMAVILQHLLMCGSLLSFSFNRRKEEGVRLARHSTSSCEAPHNVLAER